MAKAAIEVISSFAFRDGTGDMSYEVWGLDEDTGLRVPSRHRTVRVAAVDVDKILGDPVKYPKELQKLISAQLPKSWDKAEMEAAIDGDELAVATKTAEADMQAINPDTGFPLIVGV